MWSFVYMPVLGDQITYDFAFAALQPTREGQEQRLKSQGVEHERRLILRAQHVDRMLGHYAFDRVMEHYGRARCGRVSAQGHVLEANIGRPCSNSRPHYVVAGVTKCPEESQRLPSEQNSLAQFGAETRNAT